MRKSKRSVSNEPLAVGRYADVMKMDVNRLPEELRHLVAYVKYWSVGDDLERGALMARKSVAQKKALVRAVWPHREEIQLWCGAHENSDEAVMFTLLLEAAAEARVDLDAGISPKTEPGGSLNRGPAVALRGSKASIGSIRGKAKLRWSESHPAEEVSTDHLAPCLDNLAARSRESGNPWIVDLTLQGREVVLGLGLPESSVHIGPALGRPPRFITVGDPTAEGFVVFYVHGAHLTEIPRRNLISTPEALRVVNEFLERGERSTAVKWERV